jgi:hypothetical protein
MCVTDNCLIYIYIHSGMDYTNVAISSTSSQKPAIKQYFYYSSQQHQLSTQVDIKYNTTAFNIFPTCFGKP